MAKVHSALMSPAVNLLITYLCLVFQGVERSRRADHQADPRRAGRVPVRVADGLRVQGLDPRLRPRAGHARRAAAVRGLRQKTRRKHQGRKGLTGDKERRKQVKAKLCIF